MPQITINADGLRNLAGRNGLAFRDCELAPLELLDELNQALAYGGILLGQGRLETVLTFQHDGIVDLIVPFDDAKLDPAKLVMWQMLAYPDCHGVFLSDYIPKTLKGDYFLHGEEMDLEAFCEKYGLEHPENPIKFDIWPATREEAGIFYTLPPEQDEELEQTPGPEENNTMTMEGF